MNNNWIYILRVSEISLKDKLNKNSVDKQKNENISRHEVFLELYIHSKINIYLCSSTLMLYVKMY